MNPDSGQQTGPHRIRLGLTAGSICRVSQVDSYHGTDVVRAKRDYNDSACRYRRCVQLFQYANMEKEDS